MNIKKLNFKQKKYILPLLFLPFALLFGYVGSQFTKKEVKKNKPEELSLSLGETQDSIMTKNDAYDEFYKKNDSRTMLGGLDKENDSLQNYQDDLSNKQKRYIDSLKEVGKSKNEVHSDLGKSYYQPKQQNDNKDDQRAIEMIKMLNGQASGTSNNNNNSENRFSDSNAKSETPKKMENEDPVKMLKRQMLMMDSLEKAKDPEYQSKLLAEGKLKNSKEKLEAFLNTTLKVSKSGTNSMFNSFYKEKENNFIKAVIDEDNKGYLGSRIRFRLLEDIFIGKNKIPKGAILYGQISGFSMQRVNLNIISVMNKGEILPINLGIYDTDGMQGLYVPQSVFRDMIKELGANSIQGTQMDTGGQGFFTSMASKLFTSTSKSIANLIKTNKAKLKYNSYVFLMDEKELKQNDNK